ncbi:MAG: DUF3263 domain-containing protein [Propionibacteriaceae bacterium]|jgi:hypothetical protein|nr:DUF3263 domain-containing protein [Propionibacteriaceae bacterium]
MSEPAVSQSCLDDLSRSILDFEKSWWSLPEAKEVEIRERFGFSTARYYQMLNQLIDSPNALEYDPLLVKRLRRQRQARHQERSAKRLKKVPV